MNRQRGDILKADNKKYKVDCWADNNIFITTFQNEGLIKNPIFILCDVDEPMNLSDNTAIFYKATNKNGEVYCVPVNIISEIKGEVELPINPILTNVEGVSLGEIVVQSLEGSLSFGGINIRTYISAENEDIEKSDNFTALTEALSKVAILTPEGTVAMDTELNETSVNPLTNKAVTEAITTLRNTKIDTATATQEIANAKSEAITKADSMLDDYDKTQVQPALEKKADKANTLAGYGITDAYDKTYLNKALLRKLDKMPFDTAPKENSPNYITSGTLYNSVNTLNQSIATKYNSSNIESGTGELSPAQPSYEGCAGRFDYVKNGKVVTVSVNITKLIANKAYIQMSGLPFPAKIESKLSCFAVYSTTNKLRNIRLDGSWLYISSPMDKFVEDEKINLTITYIRQ